MCLNSTANGCTFCNIEGKEKFLRTDKSCQATCATNEYANSLICSKCHPSCITCNNHTSCIACGTGKFKLAISVEDELCYEPCASGKYFNVTEKVCKNCSSSCSECTGPLSTQCTNCDSFTPKKYLKGSRCVTSCGNKFFTKTTPFNYCEECNSDCLRCTGTTKTECIACTEPLPFLYNNKCLLNCPANHIENMTTNKCETCPSKCSACDSQGCTGCLNNMVLVNKKCQEDCEDNWFYDNKIEKCLTCHKSCATCDGPSYRDCKSCPTGYWLNSTNSCQKKCHPKEFWVHPNNCEECNSICDGCQNITRACEIELSYKIKQSELDSDTHDLSLDLILSRESGKPFRVSNIISQKLEKTSLKLNIENPTTPLTFDPYPTILQEIALNINLPKTLKSGVYYNIQSSNPGILTQFRNSNRTLFIYKLINKEKQFVKYFKAEDIPKKEVEGAASTSGSLSSINGATSSATDTLASLGVVMAADQSGATLKFSQISKLVARLRYVNINYGALFGTFLDGLGSNFDAKTSIDLQRESRKLKDTSKNSTLELQKIVETFKKKRAFLNFIGNGAKGKFDKYVVDSFLIGKFNKGWMDKFMIKKNNTEENHRILLQST